MNDELCLRADLAHTVVRLAIIDALIGGHHILDHQTLVLLQDVGATYRHIAIIFAPQDLWLRISTDRALELHRLAAQHCHVGRLPVEAGFHCVRRKRAIKIISNTALIFIHAPNLSIARPGELANELRFPIRWGTSPHRSATMPTETYVCT